MSQTDVVLQGIRAMVIGGQLSAGSQLPVESELCQALGVSRGSLREGVRALCIMGVLETRRGAGTFVSSLDSRLLLAPMAFLVDLQTAEQRDNLLAVRRVLESEAAGRAALTITPERLAEASAALEGVRTHVFSHQLVDYEMIMDASAVFHRVVAQASESPALSALVEALSDRAVTARSAIGVHDMKQARRTFERHASILDALKQRDPDRARLLMSLHLLDVQDPSEMAFG